jgi:HlyD family secretion protein
MPIANPRRLALRLFVFGLVVAAAVFGYRYLTRKPALPVQLYTVAMGPVETLVSNTRAGTVKACRRAKIAPQSGGQIAKLYVKEGDRVRAGQVLLTLWSGELTAQLELARSQLATSKARADEACTRAANAARERERAEKLRDRGFVSQEAVEQARTQAEAQAAACVAARTDIRQGEARVRLVQAQLSRTELTAPFDGIVAEVTGEVGEFATPSPPGIPTPPAVDLIDDSCLYVSAPVDEVDAPQVRVGMSARIILDAFPARRFPGHVRRIAPYVLEVEKQARTVEVEVEFDDPKGLGTLLTGLSADIEVIAGRQDNVLRIPTSALLEGGRVLVYDPAAGVVRERKIQTAAGNWEYTEVRSGVEAGSRIVLSLDREGIEDGAKVVPEDAPRS